MDLTIFDDGAVMGWEHDNTPGSLPSGDSSRLACVEGDQMTPSSACIAT